MRGFVLLAMVFGGACYAADGPPIAFTRAQIIPIDSDPLPSGTIVVQGRKIVGIGADGEEGHVDPLLRAGLLDGLGDRRKDGNVEVARGRGGLVAASELLPKIHGNLKHYGSIWHETLAIIVGFLLMIVIIDWAHGQAPHGHDHGHGVEHHDDHEDEDHDEDHHEEDEDHEHDDHDEEDDH